MIPLEPSDEELAQRVAHGDVAAFATLYDRYARRIYVWSAHLLGSAEAEDVVQDVFARFWDKAPQFDARRGRFGWWFMAVARHHVIAQLRRRTLQQRLVAADEIERLLEGRPAGDAAPDDIAVSREGAEEMAAALATLPIEQRRVLVLAYFAGLTQSEIARITSAPLGTVKKRTRLGLQKLRDRLDQTLGSRLRGAG